ncbi:AAA ATPase-like protein [Roseiarcus fermentans]|uniref:AAA ATPase-like protein n=1 Tax=Roseiarcus fermentans TaxID=1473586 RepID=A0A366EYC1_9HYPH|nr:ATP-binding protein [Roseiarcus fermentans]RBP07392.1 AAA ATPase-like protein [Roseiarcus fermentans]
MDQDFDALMFQTGAVFTPGAPINERELFSGRKDQVLKIVEAVSQRGCHAILYGERGTGKTSLSNMITAFLARRQAFVVSRTNCDISDTYSSLWAKAFKDIEAAKRRPDIGFGGLRNPLTAPPQDYALNSDTPDGVRRTLQGIAATAALIVIFDEFDRIRRPDAITAMADTIKALSDHAVNATVLLIGVADSVDELIREHQSIERALIQVHMPAMSDGEIRGIVMSGFERLAMEIEFEACEDLVQYSQGAPYITHLLSIYSARAALGARSMIVCAEHVEAGMIRALDQWQQSVKSLYDDAVRRARNPALHRDVLLACALADVDEQRYFVAGAVGAPLSAIRDRDVAPLTSARVLKDLSEPGTGQILHRAGEGARRRYRLFNPILRPYIIMRNVRDKRIAKDVLHRRSASRAEANDPDWTDASTF